jgi:tetratricopeptide (TPR) repeat protein
MRIALFTILMSGTFLEDETKNEWAEFGNISIVTAPTLMMFDSLQALKIDHFDATLFSNMSLCWLRLGEGEKALDDASKCEKLRSNWAKAYYRKGAALMFLKVQSWSLV